MTMHNESVPHVITGEDRAFGVLQSLGIPRERARSVDNGIMVLAQRYDREIGFLEAKIRDFESTRYHGKGCICSACERLGFVPQRSQHE